MEKVKFGVIGLGHIGKRHAEMIQRNPSCDLVALSDLRPEKELEFKAMWYHFIKNTKIY